MADGRRPELVWTKRRWRCEQAECRRKSFTEAVPAVPPRKRLTQRLRASAGAAVADPGRTIVQAARDHEVSWPVVSAAFTDHSGDGRRAADRRRHREGHTRRGYSPRSTPATRAQLVIIAHETGLVSRLPAERRYSGAWQTASTLLPSGSRTNAPK